MYGRHAFNAYRVPDRQRLFKYLDVDQSVL
jgi:hypothetical protein